MCDGVRVNDPIDEVAAMRQLSSIGPNPPDSATMLAVLLKKRDRLEFELEEIKRAISILDSDPEFGSKLQKVSAAIQIVKQ